MTHARPSGHRPAIFSAPATAALPLHVLTPSPAWSNPPPRLDRRPSSWWAADVCGSRCGQVLKPFAVAKKWAMRVTDEFFLQVRSGVTSRPSPLLARRPLLPTASLSARKAFSYGRLARRLDWRGRGGGDDALRGSSGRRVGEECGGGGEPGLASMGGASRCRRRRRFLAADERARDCAECAVAEAPPSLAGARALVRTGDGPGRARPQGDREKACGMPLTPMCDRTCQVRRPAPFRRPRCARPSHPVAPHRTPVVSRAGSARPPAPRDTCSSRLLRFLSGCLPCERPCQHLVIVILFLAPLSASSLSGSVSASLSVPSAQVRARLVAADCRRGRPRMQPSGLAAAPRLPGGTARPHFAFPMSRRRRRRPAPCSAVRHHRARGYPPPRRRRRGGGGGGECARLDGWDRADPC